MTCNSIDPGYNDTSKVLILKSLTYYKVVELDGITQLITCKYNQTLESKVNIYIDLLSLKKFPRTDVGVKRKLHFTKWIIYP